MSTLDAWTPIKDKLPPTDTTLIVCARDGTVVTAIFRSIDDDEFQWFEPIGVDSNYCDWIWEYERKDPYEGIVAWMLAPAPYCIQPGNGWQPCFE